ncbi:hypothetical protein HYW75_01175 [Candidatus Pacearchaeota archaeon]|nr:hypothetical protein [Candidatus Pacearchaeota archaeon]
MENKKAILVVSLLLIVLTLVTSYYGSSDIGDYADVAKFFSNNYQAKIRSSHSYLLGFVHAPFVDLTKSFLSFKITSLIFLFLLIYSLYIISGRNKKTLLLALVSPVIWYMAPWINPIQIASLLLLWAYYFMDKYDSQNKTKDLIYSALLIGLGWAFWDTILYFGVLLAISFLYNKKVSHLFYYFIFIFLGLFPRLILDQILFNFAFYTSIKTFISGYVNLAGGIYGSSFGHTPKTLFTILPWLLAIPFMFWPLLKKEFFKENKKVMIFLTLSLLLLLNNPQIRYLLAIVPIMLLLINKNLNEKAIKIQFISSIVIAFIFIIPYIIQIGYNINGQIYGSEIGGIVETKRFEISSSIPKNLIKEDLQKLSKDFSNEIFVVGNKPDDYQILADVYWGSEIMEFVSLQDYDLWKKNESIIFHKKFQPELNIPERRQIWLEGGIKKNEDDKTSYERITYALSIGEPSNIEGFNIVKKYNLLYLSKKI